MVRNRHKCADAVSVRGLHQAPHPTLLMRFILASPLARDTELTRKAGLHVQPCLDEAKHDRPEQQTQVRAVCLVAASCESIGKLRLVLL